MPSLHSRTVAALELDKYAAGQTYIGTAGDDTQAGTSGDDTFAYGQGGDDTLTGRAGNDVFRFGASFTGADQVDGGNGHDTIILNGDYYNVNQITTTDTTFTNIETIVLVNGNDYSLTIQDGNVSAGKTLTLDARDLGANHFCFFLGDQETDGSFRYLGGAGFDYVSVGAGDHSISGGGGGDLIFFSNGYDLGDTVNGGQGSDLVELFFGSSTVLTLGAANLRNVEELIVNGLPNLGEVLLDLTLNDGNVAAGATMNVNSGFTTGTTFVLHFDGSAETDGHLEVFDNVGDDVLIGGAKGDRFGISAGGDDIVHGGAGDDEIEANFPGGHPENPGLTASDALDGGTGFDTLHIWGDFSTPFQFAPGTIGGIERILVDNGFDYDFTLDEANVLAGKTLFVDASALEASHMLRFISNQSDAHVDITGGAGADELYGGALSDRIEGGAGPDHLVGLGGADKLIGGPGGDLYDCGAAPQTTGPDYDTIVDFDATQDQFGVAHFVKGIDPTVSGGELRTGHFNGDLAAAIGSGQLARYHALLFVPDAGNLAGHIFLIVDANGRAGYQAGGDYVLDLVKAHNLPDLTQADFVQVA